MLSLAKYDPESPWPGGPEASMENKEADLETPQLPSPTPELGGTQKTL